MIFSVLLYYVMYKCCDFLLSKARLNTLEIHICDIDFLTSLVEIFYEIQCINDRDSLSPT